MYHELSPQEYQRLLNTAEQVALQLRRDAVRSAPEALHRYLANAGRSAWRYAARLAHHRQQRSPLGSAASSLREEG